MLTAESTGHTHDPLFQDALSLPSDMRARLVELLLESLNPPVQEDVDRLWADVAEARVEELRSGRVKAIPGEEVFAQIRARFAR